MTVDWGQPTIVAGLCAGTVAIGIKVIDWWLTRNHDREAARQRMLTGDVSLESKKMDDAAVLRRDLMAECTELREEIRQLQTENTKWRERYFEQCQKTIELSGQVKQLQAEIDQLRDEMLAISTCPGSSHCPYPVEERPKA